MAERSRLIIIRTILVEMQWPSSVWYHHSAIQAAHVPSLPPRSTVTCAEASSIFPLPCNIYQFRIELVWFKERYRQVGWFCRSACSGGTITVDYNVGNDADRKCNDLTACDYHPQRRLFQPHCKSSPNLTCAGRCYISARYVLYS
jgi:hypothetical protein